MPEKDFNTLAQEVEKFFNDHDKTCNAIEKAMKTQLRNLHKVKHDIDEDKELAEMAKKHHDKWFARRALEALHAEYSYKQFLHIGEEVVKICAEQKIKVHILIMEE